MEFVQSIRQMLTRYREQSGRDPHVGHAIMVSATDGAIMVRNVFFAARLIKGLELTDDIDEIVRIDGVPVRMRVNAAPGLAFVIPSAEFPARTCCDQTAWGVMMICISRGVTA
jgi:hypothetical protein